MKQWWNSISQREQRLTLIMGCFLVIGGLYWGIWQPVAARSDNAQQHIAKERQQLDWVTQQADQIAAMRRVTGSSAPASDKGLNQVVNESAGRFRVEVIRMQNRNEDLQVWIQALAFNDLLSWLAFLQQTHGIEAQFLDINQGSQPGMVEVNRLQLGRG